MRLFKPASFFYLPSLLLVFHTALDAQVATASLSGLVTDPSATAIPSVVVKTHGMATGSDREAKTDSAGYYSFPSLPVGAYEITIEQPGFNRFSSTVTLDTSQKGRLDVRLTVGDVKTAVSVEANAAVLSLDDASLGTVIQNTYIDRFPLLLRNWDDLLNQVAGVQGSRYTDQSGATSAGRTGDFNVHGVQSLQNNFILDGVDNNSISENVQELTTQVVRPSVDSIEEFKVITNAYSAEYGRSPGAAVVVSTKGGTNQVRGLLYEYLRNRNLDANDFFSNRNGLNKPQNEQNQFGGNVGTPIIKNKLFGFFDWESTRIRRGVSRITTVPLANERVGDFSPTAATVYPTIYDPNTGRPFKDNKIPVERLDPAMLKIMALFPSPNLPGDNNNFARNAGLSDDTDRYDGRVDWTPTQTDTVFGRYSYSTRARFIPGYLGGIADGTGTSAWGRQSIVNHGAAIGWTHTILPSLVNEFRVGYGRDKSFAKQDPFGKNHADEFVPGIPENPAVDGGVPLIGWAGYNTFIGSASFLPKFQATLQYEFVDSISWNVGLHAFKFGADVHAPMTNHYQDIPSTRGSLQIDNIFTCKRDNAGNCIDGGLSYADGLLGYVQSAELSNVDLVEQRLHMYSFFVQDDFKATRRLTLNLGLRYDFASPALEGKNHIANFNTATGQLFDATSGGLQARSTIQPNRRNFGPRVGIAYQLDPQTVIRSGYGIFYSLLDRQGSEDQLALNPPFLIDNAAFVPATSTQPLFFLSQGFPASYLNPADLNLQLAHIRAANVYSPSPSVQQWSFGLQRALPANFVIEANYVGTKSTHLNAVFNLNQPVNGQFPYPDFGYVEYRTAIGNSSYNGLDLTVERRFHTGLALRLAYTYSKNIDDLPQPLENGGSGNVQDPRNFHAWHGLSDFDVPNRVVLSYVWELPFGKGKPFASQGLVSKIVGGFTTSGSYTYASGRPYTPNSGGSIESSIDPAGSATAVPNVIGTPHTVRNVDCWFYTSANSACQTLAPHLHDAFALQQPGQFGNEGRNPLRGPHTSAFDFALHRNFQITERTALQFRWEVFNLTNTVQFGLPNTDLSSGSAGAITTLASDPRIMQFALRLSF